MLADAQSGMKAKLGGDSKSVCCVGETLCFYSTLESPNRDEALLAAQLRTAPEFSLSHLSLDQEASHPDFRLPSWASSNSPIRQPRPDERSISEVDENRKVLRV